MKRSYSLRGAAGMLAFLLLMVPALGQLPWHPTSWSSMNSPEPGLNSPRLVYLLQGERRRIAGDFVASLDGDRLKVSLEDQGLIRTTAQRELVVSLIQADGRRTDLIPDSNGNVVFDSVQAGFAALIVTANQLTDVSLTSLYAAVPVFMVAAEDQAAEEQLEVERIEDSLSIPLAEVDPITVLEDVNREVLPAGESDDVMELREFELVPLSRFRVQRLADGSVAGQVVVPQDGYLAVPGVTTLTFQRNGTVLASTKSDEEGKFVAENVPVGTLSMVATGPSGHAAYAVEVVAFNAANAAGGNQSSTLQASPRFVSFQEQVGRELLVLLIPPALMDEVRRLLNERLGGLGPDGALASDLPAPPVAAEEATSNAANSLNAAGGFAGGGFGGGAGGGAFAGGGGGALGIAALATAVAALATNDGDGFSSNISTPLTPATSR